MTANETDTRVARILQVMDGVKKSPLTVNQYFKENDTPFGRERYYHYKRVLEERGIEGLHDQRSKGNNLKFTEEMKNFVKGLLAHDLSMTAAEVQEAIKKESGAVISTPVIRTFRRENGLNWTRTGKDPRPLLESVAAEMIIALALGTGLIDAITDSICACVEKKQESKAFKESVSLPADHTGLRLKGRFTPEYNKAPRVSESRFKSIEEKVSNKRFASMAVFNLSRKTIKRYALALFLLPLVTTNGRVRNVDSPKGNVLKHLCGFNYKAATLDRYIRELKYLQLSGGLIEATTGFWIDFWANRSGSGSGPDGLFACYYIDGNTKALWSSKPCQKGKVTMVGRVMNCLEQVFIHDGQGHPLYFQSFSGHADLGQNALEMMDRISKYLEDTTTAAGQFTVNRILIMDAAANGVKTLRAITRPDNGYHFITMLNKNVFNDRKVKDVTEKKRYDHGDAYLVDCTIELEDSNDKGYLFETRAVQVHWDNGRTCVLATSVPGNLMTPDHAVKSYFDRWPFQELDFKDMKSSVNLHRVVGYGKKLVDNTKVLEKIVLLQEQVSELESVLKVPLMLVREHEKDLQSKIEEERQYREKSVVVDGKRELSARETRLLESVQKEINSLKRKIKKVEKANERPFKSLKKKKRELARIIDKKKVYCVDVELDQLMTCFKVSFASTCSYLLEECFKGEKMTLQRLFETVFNLRATVRVEDNQRKVFITRNPKQEDIMAKLRAACDVLNRMGLKDFNGDCYNFQVV
jgi:transposase